MFVRGRQLWAIALDSDNPPAGDPSAGQGGQGSSAPRPPPSAPPAQPAPTLTQQQVDSIVATRIEEARKARDRELAEVLGVPVDEAKKLIEAQRAADDAQKTEAQRAREAADREKAAAQTAVAQAQAATRKANATLAIANAGVRGDRVAAATTLLLAELPAEADEAAMKGAAEKFRETYPEFFGVSGEPGKPPAYNPGGAPRANGSTPGGTGVDAGRARAREEFKNQAESYKSPFEGMTLIGGPPSGGGR